MDVELLCEAIRSIYVLANVFICSGLFILEGLIIQSFLDPVCLLWYQLHLPYHIYPSHSTPPSYHPQHSSQP